MLTVFTLFIRSKNPVIADFTEEKRNRQDAKKVLHSAFNQDMLLREATRHFFVVSNYVKIGAIPGMLHNIPE